MTPVHRRLAAAALVLLTACGAGSESEDAGSRSDTASTADATHVTRPGHLACTSREALDSLLKSIAAGDSATFGRMTTGGARSCFPLKRDTRVQLLGTLGPLSEIRAVGMARSMWVPREALQ